MRVFYCHFFQQISNLFNQKSNNLVLTPKILNIAKKVRRFNTALDYFPTLAQDIYIYNIVQ